MHAGLFRSLYRIRRVEEEVARVYATDKIKSPVHLSIGQEGVSVGVCEALQADDVVFGTYRGHALYLAKGGDMRAMVAELYGKATGCTRGKGGSMHLIDTDCGVMGTSAVVGTTIANAAGYAYAMKLRQSSAVVACFFGDGASEEGVFTETLNFAVLKQLPLLFVCENNGYAIHTNQARRQGVTDICARARAYGVPAERLDGNDVVTLRGKALQAIAKMRSGQGPQFIEATTYRWREHVGPGSDYHLGFRDKSECEPWLKSDPVRLMAEQLVPEIRTAIEAEVEREVAKAFEFAETSPYPESWELMTDIFTEETNESAACVS